MIRNLMIKIIFVLVLTVTSAVSAIVVTKDMGWSMTPQVYACGSGGGSDGGC